MLDDFNVITGTLAYKEIIFSFAFDGEELRMIPPKDKHQETHMWFMKYLGKGVYAPNGDAVYIEDDYLIGKCNENGQKIIFFPQNKSMGYYNFVLCVQIEAYVFQKYERELIDQLGFTSPEIDCIYPTNCALDNSTWSKDGIVSIKTKDFNKTSSQKQVFSVDGKEISVIFDVSRNSSEKIGKPSLELHSKMFFQFEKTNDYSVILKLWRIAKCFIQFLCYRKNINLPLVDIYSPCENEKHYKFATLYIVKYCK